MLAVICDDLAKDRDILLDFCARYAKNNHLPVAALSFENAGALLQSREARSADVIFMDIYMEGALGVDAARILRGKGFRGALVFTTTSREHYADGFDVEASHYLIKPISWEAFCEAMRRTHDRMGVSARKVRVTAGRNELDVDISGIWYVEVYGHKTVLHTLRGEVAVNQSLSALEERLGGDPFLRCYRYFIVNMDFVKRLNEDCFLMKDGREIPLSRDGRTALKNRYMAYVFGRMEE
ncbi:LytR/AlgR family response regulator transcription factor [Murimonas intestini]|uniref:Stage 0 sporulation protein A homolog n=1 Tax=Murimonas intestini TaxID=1337051 RepID=A0AB73T3E3_9FIRM|nr:LytTR family DNA-binding domain-containing protein [Murimonas intestini]MCR1841588.1 LytTR family DNA-binding domain-containing protein [Murimonas intestini]MCR1867093.1 LytTR family DNA-binding domain-containing protein [Murimonas intestini]MCR1884116.1 LytTR family DNA-binding domain-containing protein [Murimonas intestini]